MKINEHPFAHAIIDDFLNKEQAEKICKDFPTVIDASHISLNKNANQISLQEFQRMPKSIQQLIVRLNSGFWLNYLDGQFGLKTGLVADMTLFGGGMNQILEGGFLNVHVDCNHHPQTGLSTMINLILFLNQDWKEEDGGCLQLWSEDKSEHINIEPIFNRCIIFETSKKSWHGHPVPVAKGKSINSISLTYYGEKSRQKNHSTIYLK